MEAVGTYRLILDTRFYLDLMNTFYVPSISRNLVSLSKLDVVRYSFKLGMVVSVYISVPFLLDLVLFMMDYID